MPFPAGEDHGKAGLASQGALRRVALRLVTARQARGGSSEAPFSASTINGDTLRLRVPYSSP